jgi:hypothetical protein
MTSPPRFRVAPENWKNDVASSVSVPVLVALDPPPDCERTSRDVDVREVVVEDCAGQGEVCAGTEVQRAGVV